MKSELGDCLFNLRMDLTNITTFDNLLDKYNKHNEFPALNKQETWNFLLERYFKNIDPMSKIFKEIVDNKITLIENRTKFEELLKWYEIKSILLFVFNIEDDSNSDLIKTFIETRTNYHHNDNLYWVIDSKNFDKNQNESKSRIILFKNGVIEIENYTDIFNRHKDLEQLKMPTGFIYAQLNYHDHPKRHWPNNEWQDISEQYAGLFFRVIGGNSRALDRTQDQSYPGLVIENSVKLSMKVHNKINITIIPGQWSDYVRTGGTYQNKKRIGLSFHVTNDEVRPKNTAIRIWKCLGDVKEKRLWSRERIKVQIFSTSMSMLN